MRRRLVAVFAMAMALNPALADELLINEVRESDAIEVHRGSTMEQVKRQYGEPESVRGPVGEPPITRWIYDDYTIYFEHDRAIHAVAER